MSMFGEHLNIGRLWPLCALLVLAGCGGPDYTLSPKTATSRPYCVKGTWYYPQEHYELEEVGMASHYGGPDGCHGEPTATGEFFDMHAMTAAHRTLPLPCVIFVENLENGKTAILRVNDRGPYKYNRILDVSAAAAHALGFYKKGIAKVRLRTLVDKSLALRYQKPSIPCAGMERYVAHVLHRNVKEPFCATTFKTQLAPEVCIDRVIAYNTFQYKPRPPQKRRMTKRVLVRPVKKT